MRLNFLLAIAALGLTPARAQEQDCPRPTVRVPLKPNAVPDNLEARAHAALDHIQHPQNRKEVEDLRPGLRDKVKQSLGYSLLPWPPDLRTSITGTVQREGYRVEKLAFQTLPNVMMTAHLYVPDGITTPVPAVLFWSGHSSAAGKLQADAQAFGISMVRRGFVVLIADSMGTGERIADSNIHYPESLLVGLSEAGIDEYETRCALEFLVSRKDVDADRIGMTGVDDAGFNTWITAALQERVAAAVPVDSTYDFGDRIHRMRATDWGGAEYRFGRGSRRR